MYIADGKSHINCVFFYKPIIIFIRWSKNASHYNKDKDPCSLRKKGFIAKISGDICWWTLKKSLQSLCPAPKARTIKSVLLRVWRKFTKSYSGGGISCWYQLAGRQKCSLNIRATMKVCLGSCSANMNMPNTTSCGQKYFCQCCKHRYLWHCRVSATNQEKNILNNKNSSMVLLQTKLNK